MEFWEPPFNPVHDVTKRTWLWRLRDACLSLAPDNSGIMHI